MKFFFYLIVTLMWSEDHPQFFDKEKIILGDDNKILVLTIEQSVMLWLRTTFSEYIYGNHLFLEIKPDLSSHKEI